MSEDEKKQKKDDNSNLGTSLFDPKENQLKNSDNSKTLIGNKRERSKTEENQEEQSKKCIYCNNMNSFDIFELDNISQSQKLINSISKKIKEGQFIKSFKVCIESIYQNNEIKKNNIICYECFLNNFIKGGINKIFLEKKIDNDKEKDNNTTNKDLIENDQRKKLKEIVDIYSINLNLAIKSLKELRMKYSEIINTTKELLENTAIRIMLSRNHEFTDYKQKTDNCKQNLDEIQGSFDVIINDLTKKEELKKFIIEGVFSNDNLSKNNLLKVLKQVQNEIEFSTININGGDKKGLGKENDKRNEPKNGNLLFDTETNKTKENNDKSNNNLNIKNVFPNNINNINTNNLLNFQNPKKQSINDPLMLNNNDFLNYNLFMPSNYLQDIPFIRPGLGLFPNFGSQLGSMPNNILINNLFPPNPLNPQLIEQINNNQINSIFPNNENKNNENANFINNNVSTNNNSSNNENNKNINNLNNLNNIQFPGIGGCLPRSNFPFNNPTESLKELENLFTMKNLMNNHANNIMNNNLYSAQNPLNLSHLPFTNFANSPSLLSPSLGPTLGSPSLFNNILNLQGNNDISNNNLDQNKINNLNIMNRERNILNQNNIKGTNTNNINNLNILPNIPNIHNINGMNLNLSNNFNNLNNSNNSKEKQLVNLFNLVADGKKSKNPLNIDNYPSLKNTNINNNNNNNIQIDMNNNEQNNIVQTNLEIPDTKTTLINNNENNNNNISEKNGNTEINNININIMNQKNTNDANDEKEQIKKDK